MTYSVTTKFPNWHYYSNTTNVIYWGWTGLVRMFIYMMCKFQLLWMLHMRITIVLVKSVFCHIEGFKMEQRAVIKICVKLKKSYWNVLNVEKCIQWRMFIENKCVWMAQKVQRRVRVITKWWTERPSFNFQNRRIDRSHSKAFGQTSNFECSDVRRNDRDQ
jgi:hypothetical protein